MKPDEDMHANVEEVDLDPCDLYTDLGTLIVEGRVPGLTDKGFGEGPHCPTQHAQNRHQCNTSSPECQKYEQILKHMLLLWKNGIPMTIEVLLYPNCCISSQNVESVPDMAYILLEQWTIHMLPRRVPDASINPRGLIQAVRSFLYFSQLCAWFSLTGGKSPRNIHYRVCVPGEAFSSKFSSPPDLHVFPVANIGRNTAMKVLAKSHPRCGEIPSVLCYKHSQEEKTKCRKKEEQLEGEFSCLSPGDSMLGDSLLDPPNSLCMYPKRYQSPSRCGSPSIEVPEHLMFGKSRLKQETRRNKKQEETRSRPQRRPVVERFLKKDLDDLDKSDDVACRRTLDQKIPTSKKNDILGMEKYSMFSCCCLEDCIKDVPTEEVQKILEKFHERNTGLKCCHTNVKNSLHDKSLSHLIDKLKRNSLDNLDKSDVACRTLDQKIPTSKKTDILSMKKDCMFNYCCLEDCIKDEKMEEILKKLQERNTGLECCHACVNYLSEKKNCLQNKSLSHLFNELKINSNLLEQNKELKKNMFYKNNEPCDSKNLFKQALRLHKESSKRKFDRNGISPSVAEVHKYGHSKEQLASLENKLNRFQSSDYFQSKNDIKLICVPEQQNTLETESLRYVASKTYPRTYPEFSSVNIKKCGAFLVKGDQNGEFLSDEREISATVPAMAVEAFDEDIPQISFIIPSAEKKALFRRSLDSATSLVFHQRSGLPLTSSPAPVRKSGTCFDFDSSLTSVSAIKRALFEKEPEEEIVAKENTLNLYNSISASIVSSSLLGTFEESVLNGRLEPVSTVEGFTAEIGASGSFCPRHITLPVTVFFYTLQDMDKVTSPYMGHINLRNKDYHIPKKGTVQVTLFNPHRTVVKMFVVRYDLSDMPVNCQTFLRQRTLYMPSDALENDPDSQKWLRYLIHLRFMSSKSGRIYLHTDVRVIIFRKSDLDAATVHGQRPYELRSFTHGPLNPKFSSHKP